MSAVSHSIAPTEPAQTAQGHSGTPQPISGPQNGAERDELAAALVRQICISTELRRERDEARAELDKYLVLAPQTCPLGEHAEWLVDSEHLHPCPWCERDRARGTAAALEAENARLNRRVQVAESAIAELTGTGEGKASQVSREIWTRCEESHGLLVYCADGLTAIASIEPTGAHISISAPGRYPTWDEIASIKERVFPDLPMVMALPPRAEHVNLHQTCLHIWEATP